MKSGRRGAVLLIVLVLIIALGAVSGSALVLARSELVAERSGRRFLAQRTEGEGILFGGHDVASTEDWTRMESDLGRGYRLIEARPAEGLSMFSVGWLLDPEAVTEGLPGALQSWMGTEPAGLRWMDGCPSEGTRPLFAGPPAGEDEGVASGSGPGIGPLGIPELLALPGIALPASGLLPTTEGPEILRAVGTVRLWGGEAEGLLVADGDVRLDASAHFEGLAVVGGRLEISGSASVAGVALVGRDASLSEDAKLLGCPDLVLAALRIPALFREHPLPDGSFLGRY